MGLTISPFPASRFESYTTTVTAGGITTLTSASTFIQVFTGTANQTWKLPVASTLSLGFGFLFVNRSTQTVDVVTSASAALSPPLVLQAGASALVFCILTSGTTSASWNVSYDEITLELAKAYTDISIASIAMPYLCYADWYTDAQLPRTDEDDILYSVSAPGPGNGTLGGKLLFRAGGLFAANATATVQLKIWMVSSIGILVYDSGAISVPVSSFWDLDVIIMNTDGSTLGRAIGKLTVKGVTVQNYIQETDFDLGMDAWGSTPGLFLTGNAAGTGADAGQITGKLATLSIVSGGARQNPT